MERPNLKILIADYDLPWDIFSVKIENFKELTNLRKDPELLVFTLFKGNINKEYQIGDLRKRFPRSKLFCLSNSFCMFLAEDLAHIGIDGFAVLEELNEKDFLISLESLMRGEKSFPSLNSIAYENLTIKELITIRHIAAGLSVKQIAYLFNKTEHAIKKRKDFIMQKLSLHTTEEISAWAAVRMNIPKKDELLSSGEWLMNFFKEF